MIVMCRNDVMTIWLDEDLVFVEIGLFRRSRFGKMVILVFVCFGKLKSFKEFLSSFSISVILGKRHI